MEGVVIFWLFLILLPKIIQTQTFSLVAVNKCPSNQTEWNKRAKAKNCRGKTPDYLCASIKNYPGKLGEICTQKSLIKPGECVVLHGDEHNFDSMPCDLILGCPDRHYSTSELYKFQGCFGAFYSWTTMKREGEGTTPIAIKQTAIEESSSTGIAVGLLLPMLIVGTAVIIFVMYRRNKLSDIEEENIKMIPDTEEHVKTLSSIFGEERTRIISKIHKLQCYLIHILKTELKVWDLKEKSIIYSLSLIEHFNECLLRDLENVKNTEDYDNLDMVVVFTLVINFCNNIKPPGKGWGYKPTDDDDSLEADIERIRILWNMYCDDQVDVPYLQGVYGRMSDRFGALSKRDFTSSNNADYNALESKIKIVRLKRNCDVEDTVVVTKNIKSALVLLESSDIVICVGAIGSGKTTAMRYIQDKYKDRGWRNVWFEEYLNENKLMENEIINVFLCCDNLFGTFNCNVFSLETITGFEHVIKKQRERCKGHLKVLLGIHQHVYDEVLKLGRVQIFDTKNLIDVDHLDKAEMLLIWKELKKEGHCVRDISCWFNDIKFSSVFSKLSHNHGLVGNPILISMYCQHHDFFSNEEFTKASVTALVNHFKRMHEVNHGLFNVLTYIMFVRVYKKNEGLMPWSGMLSAELTEDSIKRCVEMYPEYLIEKKCTVELRHELLNISLFKASYDTWTVFTSLVHHCDISTILQLTRPKEECDCDFVNCLPPSHTDKKIEAKLLERIANAKGCPFDSPHFPSIKWKTLKRNQKLK